MSQEPLCKICGSSHWAYEPHKWPTPEVTPAPEPRSGFDRGAYQREYMRAYRAKKRGTPNVDSA